MEVENVVKERDFYRAKVAELNARIRSLEYDNADLQRRDSEISERLKEVSNNKSNYRPRRR
jgi:hypothetical protein